jgi:SPP1 family predicted phage head-tail adaptor
VRIGDLNKIITIQYPIKTSDGMGGFSESFNDACTTFCAIWPVSAKEQIQSDQMAMTATHKIRIRYRRVMKPDWRIKYANRYFSIVSIINKNEANKMLDLLCNEVMV